MPKIKSFLEKKKSVAFKLVHRSQRDPLIVADGRELVLAPINDVRKLTLNDSTKNLEPAKRKEEQTKFGVYFDDAYDYLQHLKDANEVYSLEGPIEERYRVNRDGTQINAGKDILPTVNEQTKLKLPSSLFESQGIVLKTGLLNQAAPLPGPHPELDPDIVAALDDDRYDHEDADNILEDDFILKANAPEASSETEQVDVTDFDSFNRHRRKRSVSSGSDDFDDDSENDDLDSLKRFDTEETKSRFTSYSLTSSVMRRSSGLKQVDAVFEKLYEQYDDDQLGELENDDDQITGLIPPESQRVLQMVEEYEKDVEKQKTITADLINEKDEDALRKATVKDDDAEDLEKCFIEDKRKEKWDCESILSTYSKLYNHPTVICEPSRKRVKIMTMDSKTGLPTGVFRSDTLAPALARLNQDAVIGAGDAKSMHSRASTIRSKFETPEQRRLRKSLVKEERSERRKEKKLNKMAFRAEEILTNKEQINSRHMNANRLV